MKEDNLIEANEVAVWLNKYRNCMCSVKPDAFTPSTTWSVVVNMSLSQRHGKTTCYFPFVYNGVKVQVKIIGGDYLQ